MAFGVCSASRHTTVIIFFRVTCVGSNRAWFLPEFRNEIDTLEYFDDEDSTFGDSVLLFGCGYSGNLRQVATEPERYFSAYFSAYFGHNIVIRPRPRFGHRAGRGRGRDYKILAAAAAFEHFQTVYFG